MGWRVAKVRVSNVLKIPYILRLDSLEKIKAYLPILKNDLIDETKLPLIYKFAFTFYKDPASGGKNLGTIYFAIFC